MNVALVLRPAVPQSDMGVDDEVADVVLAVQFGTLPSCDGRHTVGKSLWRLGRAAPGRPSELPSLGVITQSVMARALRARGRPGARAPHTHPPSHAAPRCAPAHAPPGSAPPWP